MRKTLRINGGNEIGRTVEKSLDEYFRKLDGEAPHGIYDMVINHVERALISTVMDRAGGNQTQAADMLGISHATAERHWAYAKTWLYRELARTVHQSPAGDKLKK